MKLKRIETRTGDYFTITGKRNKENFELKIRCESQSTRYGFRHLADVELYKNHIFTSSKAKRCYYNRTWENYTFQSVILEGLETLELDKKFIKDIDNLIKEKRYNSKCYQYLY